MRSTKHLKYSRDFSAEEEAKQTHAHQRGQIWLHRGGGKRPPWVFGMTGLSVASHPRKGLQFPSQSKPNINIQTNPRSHRTQFWFKTIQTSVLQPGVTVNAFHYLY